MNKILKYPIYLLLLLLTTDLTAQDIKWEAVAPGVWKGSVGKPESYNLLTASGATPSVDGLKNMGDAPFPFEKSEITGKLSDGKTYLRFPLDKKEQLYGFGLNFQTVHQRGKILELHVDHYGGKDNGRTHAPTPFYVSSNGYGVFVNSARYLKVFAGSAVKRDGTNVPEAKDRDRKSVV